MATGTRLRGRPVKRQAEVNDAYENIRALTQEIADRLTEIDGQAVIMAKAIGHPWLDPEEAA